MSTLAARAASRRTLGQLWQQGWQEIPEVFASTGVAFIGIGLAVAGCYNYANSDGDNRRYKNTYMIMRPDDPRVQKIRKD